MEESFVLAQHSGFMVACKIWQRVWLTAVAAGVPGCLFGSGNGKREMLAFTWIHSFFFCTRSGAPAHGMMWAPVNAGVPASMNPLWIPLPSTYTQCTVLLVPHTHYAECTTSLLHPTCTQCIASLVPLICTQCTASLVLHTHYTQCTTSLVTPACTQCTASLVTLTCTQCTASLAPLTCIQCTAFLVPHTHYTQCTISLVTPTWTQYRAPLVTPHVHSTQPH